MSKLRATFIKGEKMRYAGHLDILRSFIRTLRRCGCPVKYSEGFNPHAVMTFILPTGVGVTSRCELVDITVKEEFDISTFIKGFNECSLPDSLEITDAEFTDTPMPIIEKAEYLIEIINDGAITENDITKILSVPEITVDKKSKKQTKQINIKEHIFKCETVSVAENGITLKVILSAGNSFNLKPSLAISGMASVSDVLKPLAVKTERIRYIFQ